MTKKIEPQKITIAVYKKIGTMEIPDDRLSSETSIKKNLNLYRKLNYFIANTEQQARKFFNLQKSDDVIVKYD